MVKEKEFLAEAKRRILARLKYYEAFSRVPGSSHEAYARFKNSVIAPKLVQVLKRIEEGLYGVCLECEQEIPMCRLEAVPGALMCISCERE